MIDLVCSVCGSHEWSDVQHSVDSRWPVARCSGAHRDRGQLWFPLISARAFKAREKRPVQAEPSDLFGSLPEDDQRRLQQPVKLL